MKAYLLGKLDDTSAAVLEERYFSDKEFFVQVQAVEYALIVEYLRGKLSRSDRRRFEKRYLVVADMRRRFEEVRRRVGGPAPRATRRLLARGWVQACVAGLALIAIAAWVLIYAKRARRFTPSAPTLVSAQIPALTLQLAPGLSKGGNAGGAEWSAPRLSGPIRLVFEFPGRNDSFNCSATLRRVGDDSSMRQVWQSTRAVRSAAGKSGQIAVFDVAPAILSPGDYVVVAGNDSGLIRETYNFRIAAPRP